MNKPKAKGPLFRTTSKSSCATRPTPLSQQQNPPPKAVILIRGLTKQSTAHSSSFPSQRLTIRVRSEQKQRKGQELQASEKFSLKKHLKEDFKFEQQLKKLRQNRLQKQSRYCEGWNLLASVQTKLIRDLASHKHKTNLHHQNRLVLEPFNHACQSPSKLKFSDLFDIKRASQARHSFIKQVSRPIKVNNTAALFRSKKGLVLHNERGRQFENKPISLKQLIGLREPWKEDSSGQLNFINFSQEESGWETFPQMEM